MATLQRQAHGSGRDDGDLHPELNKGYTIVESCYGRWQLHRSTRTLKQAGIKMTEFPQTVSNLTDIGRVVYDAVKHKNPKLYADRELRSETAFAVAKETPGGFNSLKNFPSL